MIQDDGDFSKPVWYESEAFILIAWGIFWFLSLGGCGLQSYLERH